MSNSGSDPTGGQAGDQSDAPEPLDQPATQTRRPHQAEAEVAPGLYEWIEEMRRSGYDVDELVHEALQELQRLEQKLDQKRGQFRPPPGP